MTKGTVMRHYTLALVLAGGLCLLGAAPAPGPAEARIEAARKRIAADPDSFTHWNSLALALAQRARETSDPSYYDRSLEALKRSFQLAPGNFEGEKIRVWALLGRHEFAAALELARALNRKAPDDVQVYGFLADAQIELGQYAEAEKAAQWMLDLRPGNVAGLTRGAYLRELFGDLDGAVEFMTEAYARTPPGEIEDRAWILTHIAHLQRLLGRLEAAERLLAEAFRLFSDYHYALAELGRVRTAQGEHAEAARLFEKHYRLAPHPENLFLVGEALEEAGEPERARSVFAEFEQAAREEMASPDNANRELIFYYADYGARPEEALRLAQREMARRQDVFTRDAYAWALFQCGRQEEARREIEAALAIGVRDPKILRHADRIRARQEAAGIR